MHRKTLMVMMFCGAMWCHACSQEGVEAQQGWSLGDELNRMDQGMPGLGLPVDPSSDEQLPELPPDGDEDGDGLSNGEEEELGLDPRNPASFDDGIPDAERVVASCRRALDIPEQFYVYNSDGWWGYFPDTLLKEPVLEANADTLHEFVSRRESVVSTIHVREARDPLWSLEQFEFVSGRFSFDARVDSVNARTWDVDISFVEPRKLEEVHAELVNTLNPEASASPREFSRFAESTRFVASVTVMQLGSAQITAIAMTPESEYVSDETFRTLHDATSHLNIMAPSAELQEARCEPFNVNRELPGVDIYMVLDQSGSMTSYNNVIIRFANEFSNKLIYSGIDYRYGVTNMSPQIEGRLRPQVGWHTAPETLAREIDYYVIDCTSNETNCSGFEEYGLFVAERGITAMKQATASPSERLRPSAKLVTIFMSDEEANSIEQGQRPFGEDIPASDRDALQQQYNTFFKAHTTAYTLYQDEDCNAFSTGGEAYAEVSRVTGGKSASLCGEDLTQFFDEIIEDLTPDEQTYALSFTPVPATLVVMTADEQGRLVEIPRSRTNGYDYNPQRNTIAFFGDYSPRSSSGHTCNLPDTPACPSGDRCVSNRCVRDRPFEVVVHARGVTR